MQFLQFLDFVINNKITAYREHLKKKKKDIHIFLVFSSEVSLHISPGFGSSILPFETVACLRIP